MASSSASSTAGDGPGRSSHRASPDRSMTWPGPSSPAVSLMAPAACRVTGWAALAVGRVQGAHAVLADRLAGRQDLLGLADLGRVEIVEQPARLGPGICLRVAGDDVQPDPERQGSPFGLGQAPHPGELL